MKKAKITAEEIRDMAILGMTCAQISRRADVSRQYISQICKKNEIHLVKWDRTLDDRPKKEWIPKPRLITAGMPVEVNCRVAGCVSELLVAADLMARGWAVFMPVMSSKCHDLIAVFEDRILTVEVRSAYKNSSGSLKFSKRPDQMKSEFYGLVVTGEPVQYDPDIPKISSLK